MADGQLAEKETPRIGSLGGHDARGGDEGEALGRRLRRYGTAVEHKRRVIASLSLSKLVGMGLTPKHVRQVKECGDWLRWREYPTANEHRLLAANFCRRALLCGFCASLRGAKFTAAYLPKFHELRRLYPNAVARFATFTVRNGQSLSEVFAHLRDSFHVLLRRRSRRGDRHGSSVMHRVLGGVYSIELTNIGNGWHPHVHVILFVDGAAPLNPELTDEWYSITGDSFVVDERPLRPAVNPLPGVDPFAKPFCEVFKYALKAATLEPDHLCAAYPVLSGNRLVGSFGIFRGVEVSPDLEDDRAALDLLPYFDFVVRYVGAGQYGERELCGFTL